MLAPFGVGLAAWLIVGALTELVDRIRLGPVRRREAPAALGLPRSAFGTTLAHAGVGIVVLGIVAATPGARADLCAEAGRDRRHRRLRHRPSTASTPPGSELHREARSTSPSRRGGRAVANLEPAKREFPGRAAARRPRRRSRQFWLSHLYVVLGDSADDGAVTVRIYLNPLVTLIWLGALVMAFGGALSLSDRRFRVGAPRPPALAARCRPARPMRCAGGVSPRSSPSSLLLASAAPALAVSPTRCSKDPRSGGAGAGACRAACAAWSARISRSTIPTRRSPRHARPGSRADRRPATATSVIGDFLVARYGDFILLKPPVNAETMLLWLAAPSLGAGGLVVASRRRRRVASPAAALTRRRAAEAGATTG